MFELDEAMTAAALRELVLEDQAALDRAIDATAERAHGRTLVEVETMLRARLHHEGLDLGHDTTRIAREIVRARSPLDV